MVGIASIYLESQSGQTDPQAWRLRGMATLPESRRQGIGGMLVSACIEHVENSGGSSIWCNARTPAVKFYERHGFRCFGSEFELPGIGPHYRMIRHV
jgi:ribosomal protein S18 acetylase RimI-like enzyme